MPFPGNPPVLLAGRPSGSQFDMMAHYNIVIPIAAFRGTGFDAASPQDVDDDDTANSSPQQHTNDRVFPSREERVVIFRPACANGTRRRRCR
jgi:hypothetical protein